MDKFVEECKDKAILKRLETERKQKLNLICRMAGNIYGHTNRTSYSEAVTIALGIYDNATRRLK